MLESVHHLNLLVRDVDAAAERYARLFNVEVGAREELFARGVVTRRFRCGATWIVLVQPTRPDSLPAKRLAERGEGLFLLSFAVRDLDAAAATVRTAGGRTTTNEPRTGLDGWRIIDVEPADLFGADIQLCEDPT
ncbi:MAG TPA: VOC family protein [Steroidobacteraceae bacterium]|nr:VOC family protein [Steroidobacteraceae bacterium]HRX88044.1 VOC family protein [Steroidobacteraceae bacterium]